MKDSYLKITILTVVAIFMASCALTKKDLLDESTVSLEKVPVDDVNYLFTNVRQDGVKVYLSGRVSLKDTKTVRDVPSHMDIEIYDSGKQKLLFVAHTPYKQYHHTGRGNQVQFLAAARLSVPNNAVVVMKHHFAEMEVHEDSS
jgi:hypothetical protein